ncbi:MAG: bifunctional oligoribonuclease/PAP phosphatase NrnA [Lachnospiraceae bacterium]|nr:bifunctional oligoribonuclease/PAP phosphatase NrnA [Lachnospiraceae bacterium]
MNNLLQCITDGIRRIGIVGHVRPDGDCAGSVMAAYHYLRDNVPSLEIVPFLQELPYGIRFLTKDCPVRQDDGEGERFDLVISLDAAAQNRIGAGAAAFNSCENTVCIDHHQTCTAFGKVNCVDPHASSACEVLYRLLSRDRISYDTAVCLYTGIIHDTGALRFDNVSPETVLIVSDLIARKIPFTEIIEKSFTEKSLIEMKITGEIIKNSRLFEKEHFLYGVCDLPMQKRYQIDPNELGSVVAAMNEVREARVVLFVYQFEDGSWKGSLRSKCAVDVAKIALRYGGGGHVKAAGFSFSEDPDRIAEEIRGLLSEEEL